MIWCLVIAILASCASCTIGTGSVGTEFVFSLSDHFDYGRKDLYLLVESRLKSTSLHIVTPHIGHPHNRGIARGMTKVPLNIGILGRETGISNNCVHLKFGAPVSAHVVDYVDASADGALLLPVFKGPSEYFAALYTTIAVRWSGAQAEIAVSTLYDGTDVYVDLKTPSGTINLNGQNYSDGDTIHVTLNKYDSLQLKHGYDLTGTRITSNNPISVVSGDSCVDIGHGGCDHIFDQMPPVSEWGSNFILTQLQTFPSVTFRIVAARDDTNVTIGSSDTHTLSRGEFLDQRLTQTDAVVIQSTKPVLVVQFSESKPGGQGDPSMAVVPSLDHFRDGYVFTTPTGKFDSHHLTLTIETSLAAGLRMKGHPVNRTDEKRVVVNIEGQSKSFSLIRLPVSNGGHDVTHVSGAQFGALLFGFGSYKSYGYSLGYEYTVPEGSRLVHGNSSKSGSLEILVRGAWTQACAGEIGLNETVVICRAQGYDKYPLRQEAVQHVQSTNSKTVNAPSIQCLGSEFYLSQCNIKNDNHTCASGEVFIDCEFYLIQRKIRSNHSICAHGEVLIGCAPQLKEIVHIQCTVSGWLVDIDMDKLKYRYPGSVETDIYMGDNSCRGKLVGSHLQFNYGVQDCLTTQSSPNNSLVLTNELIYAYHDPTHPSNTGNFNWTFDLSCLIPRNQSTLTTVVSNNQSTSTVAPTSPVGGYQLKFKLFTDPNYLNAISGTPIHVAVGTDVYVKAYVENVDFTVTMKLNTCYTSTSASGGGTTHYLIKDGCEVDANTHIIRHVDHETRFVFDVFQDGLYLNCDAIYCDNSNPASFAPCERPCNIPPSG